MEDVIFKDFKTKLSGEDYAKLIHRVKTSYKHVDVETCQKALEQLNEVDRIEDHAQQFDNLVRYFSGTSVTREDLSACPPTLINDLYYYVRLMKGNDHPSPLLKANDRISMRTRIGFFLRKHKDDFRICDTMAKILDEYGCL